MKNSIIAYLSFNGNAREALEFYQSCIGGELAIDTIGSGPMAEHYPADAHNLVMHGQLTKGGVNLMASDMGGNEITVGNNVSMMLFCDTYADARSCFEKLSQGGHVSHPISDAFWGGIFGHLTDKYGFTWMVHAAAE
jgi:PhnB protein